MSAILFGSISTVADTSELQREAFNHAFFEHGLGWQWDREDYLAQLEKAGGQDRIAAYADSRGQQVDAAAVHATKSRLFQESLATRHLEPRPGVVDVISQARSDGVRVGLVTTTSPENVSALLDSLDPDVSREDFDVTVDVTSVGDPKPDPAAYDLALTRLGEDAGDCVAIEDNLDGVEAARAAGLQVVAFPNQNTAGHDFEPAQRRTDALVYDDLLDLIGR